jgi:hypothetical protein
MCDVLYSTYRTGTRNPFFFGASVERSVVYIYINAYLVSLIISKFPLWRTSWPRVQYDYDYCTFCVRNPMRTVVRLCGTWYIHTYILAQCSGTYTHCVDYVSYFLVQYLTGRNERTWNCTYVRINRMPITPSMLGE